MSSILSLPPTPAGWLRDSPIAACEAPYRRWLELRGYTIGTQRHYLRCLAHFALWTMRRPGHFGGLGAPLVSEFLDEHLSRCRCPGRVQRCRPQVRAALAQLPAALDGTLLQFVLPEPDLVAHELALFEAYLRDQRGLAPSTCYQRRTIVGHLLRSMLDGDGQLPALDAAALRRFMLLHLERWSPASAGVLASSLRGYLRYRAFRGDDVVALTALIASPANWRLASLPRTLGIEDVERVLASFEPGVPSWRRGAAIAQCIARLGLRSSEVVSLELEDLDWSGGLLRIGRCKGRRVDVLPLLPPVGEAITAYLQHERPPCRSRRVFVRAKAPREAPIGTHVVKQVINDACRRCDLPYTGVHRFRHSLASRLLDGGSTLKEVADVLRHRHLETTQIYAKLDERRLSEVVMAWPGSLA